MIVYKTTFPDGMLYIGQSIKNNPNYFGSGRKMLQMIKAVGKKNLKKEILKVCSSNEELDEVETLYIEKFDTSNPNIGYNLKKVGGGRGAHSEETILLMKGNTHGYKKGSTPWNKDKHHSLETRERLSVAWGNRKEKYPVTEEYRKKCSTSQRKIFKRNQKRVVQLDLELNYIQEFNSIQAAARYLDMEPQGVVSCLKGRNKTCGGFIWVYREDYLRNLIQRTAA